MKKKVTLELVPRSNSKDVCLGCVFDTDFGCGAQPSLFCVDDTMWQEVKPTGKLGTPEERKLVAKILKDYLYTRRRFRAVAKASCTEVSKNNREFLQGFFFAYLVARRGLVQCN